jgi:polyhydroxyalkanoate synthesis regulator phasin
MAKSTIKSYVEAGAQFTEMSRQQAEAVVKRLVKSGDLRRRDTEHMVQSMLSRGRETTDRISALVQTEVAKQLKTLSARFEDVEGRLESLAASIRDGIVGTGAAGAPQPQPAPSTPSVSHTTTPAAAKKSKANKSSAKMKSAKKSSTKKSSTKKSSTKKSSAKKSSAKKSSAKKSSATKSSAKKSSTKKSSAKKSADKRSSSGAVGSSGVRKVSTTRPAPSSE